MAAQLHSAQLHSAQNPDLSVVVDGGVVHFVDFVESDPDVVAVIADADDPEAAAHALLRVGGQAVRVASSDLNTELVERRFAGMANVFDTRMSDVVTKIGGAADQLLDEETGSLPRTLAGLRSDLERLLGDTFDTDSKTSVIAKIEAVVADNASQMVRNVRATFDLDQPGSPLARTKTELVEVVKGEIGVLAQQIREIATAVAAKNATAAVADKLTSKGVDYEELICIGLDRISAVHGDVVHKVGTTTGANGTKRGDLNVTLCPDDTFGHEACFVIEAKDRALSMSKTLAELDSAMENHHASAAIAVFARADLSPVSLSFWYSGSRAILVFDKDEPDPQALQLAYEWARWATRRSVAGSTEESIDAAEVEAAITRACQALSKHQTIKACHSAIKKKADEAATHVDGLVDEVNHAMRELRDAANRAA